MSSGVPALDALEAAEVLDALSAQVAVLGPDGRIRRVNRAWEQFGRENSVDGVSPSVIGVDYLQLCRDSLGPDRAEAGPAADGIAAVLEGRQASFVLEYPCHAPDRQRWFSMHVTPLPRPGTGVVVAHSDITVRKLAELSAAAHSHRVKLALKAARMGVWSLDLRTGRIEWSDEVHEVLQVAEFGGTLDDWYHLVHPQDLAPMQARFKRVLARREAFRVEFRFLRPDGGLRWLENVGHVECGPDGQPVALIGTVEDVTERRSAASALLSYNRVLELIAGGAGLRQALEEVVRLLEDQLPGALCSILVVERPTQRLRFGAGPSLPEAYNQAVDGVPVGPKVGSCGTAAWRKEPVVVTDIASDPLWESYRALALRHGLRACVSIPIFASGNVANLERGQVVGTFALYYRQAGRPPAGVFDALAEVGLPPPEALLGTGAFELQPRLPRESARLFEAAHLAGVAIERELAGQAVRESEERLRSVLDSSPAATFLKDLAGRHLFVNRRMAELFDVPQNRWVGRTAPELIPASLAETCERCDQQVRESGRLVQEQLTCRLPTAREVTVVATHFPLLQADGRPYAICGILTDITDLLSAQEQLYRLWTHAPEPLCVAGLDGRFLRLNPAWSRHLGWTEAELLERPWRELLHPDDQAATEQAFQRLKAGEPIQRFENRFRCADGSYRWLSWDAIARPAEGTIFGFVRDVTRERELSDQVRQAQKMEAIGQLASGVAHDFNNLLTVINGYCDLLLMRLAAEDPNRKPLAQVQAAGRRAGELTAQLLAFSRRAIVEPKVLDLNQAVESSARMLRRLIGEDVLLVTNLSSIPAVKIDPGQLEQVLMNLAVNARDAMPSGGRLTIATDWLDLGPRSNGEAGEVPGGPHVRVSVSDTGSGMSPAVLARVFEPFFTTKPVGKGTGLGLATVYGVVRQAGGTISVQSEPERGTTFTILLPAHGEPPPVQAESGALAVAPRGTETILLVEDEAGVREIARHALELQGYRVLTAATGAEALEIERRHAGPLQLLLTDVVMPGLGGRALADQLRGRRPTLAVLFMSGYTDDAVLRHGVETSRDQFLQKPFTPRGLARRVREVLDLALDRG